MTSLVLKELSNGPKTKRLMTTDFTWCWRTSPDLLNISWLLLSWYSISANITLFLIRSIDGHWIVWFEAHKQFELIWSSYCHFLDFIWYLIWTHCWYNSSGWISKDQKSHYVWIVSTQSRRPDLRRLGKVLLAQLTPLGFVPASLEIYMGRGDELTGFNLEWRVDWVQLDENWLKKFSLPTSADLFCSSLFSAKYISFHQRKFLDISHQKKTKSHVMSVETDSTMAIPHTSF